jgi:hypothetical protein
MPVTDATMGVVKLLHPSVDGPSANSEATDQPDPGGPVLSTTSLRSASPCHRRC